MTRPSAQAWQAPLLLLVSLLAIPVLAVSPPPAGGQRALIFAAELPPTERLRRIGALDGRIVREGATARVVIAEFDRAVAWRELLSIGAILSVDPLALGGCFAAQPIETS